MALAPHSSTLAWKIPWTEEPGGLPSMGSQSRTRLKQLSSSSSSSSQHLQWFWSPPQIKSVTVSIVSHLLVMKWWDRMPWFFWILSFKPTFSLSSYTFIKRLFSYHMTFYKRQKSKAQRTNQLFTRLALGQVGGWWYKEITLVLPIFCTLFAEKVTRTFFMNA